MGEIPPDQVHIPGIYVNRVVQAERMGLIERHPRRRAVVLRPEGQAVRRDARR